MTRVKREEQSRLRAEEHQRRRRNRLIVFFTAVALYVLVPLAWSAGVEFGVVSPIRTGEFKHALDGASLVLLFTMLYFVDELYKNRGRQKEKSEEKSEVAETETAAT